MSIEQHDQTNGEAGGGFQRAALISGIVLGLALLAGGLSSGGRERLEAVRRATAVGDERVFPLPETGAEIEAGGRKFVAEGLDPSPPAEGRLRPVAPGSVSVSADQPVLYELNGVGYLRVPGGWVRLREEKP